MITRDIKEVLNIENNSFAYPWRNKEFKVHRKARCATDIVYEQDGKVLGFMIYNSYKDSFEIVNLAVHPDCRRNGVGRSMLDQLKRKLERTYRREIFLEVPETNVSALNFYKSNGFLPYGLFHKRYAETREDGVRLFYIPN